MQDEGVQFADLMTVYSNAWNWVCPSKRVVLIVFWRALAGAPLADKFFLFKIFQRQVQMLENAINVLMNSITAPSIYLSSKSVLLNMPNVTSAVG
jgi:hypothetical protein